MCLPTPTQPCKASSGSHDADPMPVLMTLCLSFTHLGSGTQKINSISVGTGGDLHSLIQIPALLMVRFN